MNETPVMRSHLIGYGVVAAILLVVAILAPGLEYRGTPSLHTIWEVMATVLALVAGALALVRYHARQDLPYLFIGAGLIGAGLFDAFHAWSSSVYAYRAFPTPLEDLTIWGWTVGRLYFGVMLLFAGWAWWWKEDEPGHPKVGARQVFAVSAGLIAAVIALFLFVPLPQAIVPDWPVPRPHDLVPGLLLVGALAGFFMGRWRREPAEHWIVQALIVSAGLHIFIIPFSTGAWDTRFELAHWLKILGYGLVFIGLIINVRSLHRTILDEERRLNETNRRLEHEVIRRSDAEQVVARERSLLESIFESLSDGVLVTDTEGKVVRFNRTAAEITGVPIDELGVYGEDSDYQVFHPDEETPLKRDDLPTTRALRGEEVHDLHVFFKNRARPEGIHLTTAARPLRNAEGAIIGSVTVFRDVTTGYRVQEQLRRYTAELERRNRDLQDFATIVSHDLKEPLRKVLAFGERLDSRLSADVEPEARDYLRRMRHGAERMRTLVDDLLAYTRLGQKDHLEEVDLTEIAQRAVADLDERIRETDGKVEVHPIGRVECDPVQMYHVFINLIGNGLKYHRDGVPPRVIVSGTTDGEECTVRVEDNGIGFDMKYAQRIFRPFHRLHTRSEYEGSGIGLAIVRKVVEHHGGTIDVESAPDQGTTFTFQIPVRQRHLEVKAAA